MTDCIFKLSRYNQKQRKSPPQADLGPPVMIRHRIRERKYFVICGKLLVDQAAVPCFLSVMRMPKF